MRTYDIAKVTRAVSQYAESITGFYPEYWLADEDNIALIDGEDVALFEYVRDGVYFGHYFFKSRGKDAVTTAQRFLKEAFAKMEVIQGLTPLTHLGARWLNKRLGFKSYGVIKTPTGPCELLIMTKDEWETLHG